MWGAVRRDCALAFWERQLSGSIDRGKKMSVPLAGRFEV